MGRQTQTQLELVHTLDKNLPQRLESLRQKSESLAGELRTILRDGANASQVRWNVGDNLDQLSS